MKCDISVRLLTLIVILYRLYPDYTSLHAPYVPSQEPLSLVSFIPVAHLNSLDIIASTRRPSHLIFSHLSHPSGTKLITICTILLSGDIELNPGPRQYKHPCGVCSKPVKSNQKGIQCEVCNFWLHTRCIGIPDDEYRQLQSSVDPWCCKRCQEEALPYHNVSNSDYIFNTSNPASVLNTSAHHSTTSAPQSPSPSLTVLYTNCRSILPKLDHLRILVTAHNPHIIAICETWLDANITNDELLIPGFSVIHHL